MSQRKLNVGFIGGGGKAFIVHAHDKAIHMDGTRQVTCAALHQDPAKAMEYAANWPYPIKGYPDYATMIREEAERPEGERADYFTIVTPNHAHFAPAMACLWAGFPVFCEKPITITTEEASLLAQMVKQTGIPFGLAHTYLGHWTTRFAKWIVQSGLLGNIRRVDSHYQQGWLARPIELDGQQQAAWRVDPRQAGISGCGGDIGTHAYMQLRFVTGLEVAEILYARLTSNISGRQLDDGFTTICRLDNGAEAHICASQVMIGHKNGLGLEVTGERGTLVWNQEESEKVIIHLPDQSDLVYWRGAVPSADAFLGRVPQELLDQSTLPAGHPEGLHDAFARLHRDFEFDVRRRQNGELPLYAGDRYASVYDGEMHMGFISAAVESSTTGKPVIPV